MLAVCTLSIWNVVPFVKVTEERGKDEKYVEYFYFYYIIRCNSVNGSSVRSSKNETHTRLLDYLK